MMWYIKYFWIKLNIFILTPLVWIEKKYNDYKDAKLIAVCGSGVGMNIALNKQKGIFCVLGHSSKEVKKAREHNNVNAIAFGGRTTCFLRAKSMLNTFFKTEHLGGKYLKRMTDIDLK